MLSQDKLKRVLHYSPETGEFTWLKTGRGIRPGGVAGTITNKGYLVICIDLQRYLASRLAWLYMTGKFPEAEIDHINGASLDNRYCNLREAKHHENLANTKNRKDNIWQQPGVCWDKQKLKWKVQISKKGSKRIQKHFSNFDDAVNFYRDTARELFGNFASKDKIEGPLA